MKIIVIVIVMILILLAVLHFFPQINFREKPEGLCQAQLPAEKPNWVSSLVDKNDAHYIEPLQPLDLNRLEQCLQQEVKKVTLVEANASGLIAYRQTPLLNFVDWLCITAQGDVTSSATMGYYDFGKNRELIEQIRSACQK